MSETTPAEKKPRARARKPVPPPEAITREDADPKALAEAQDIAAGSLGGRKKLSAYERAEKFKDMLAQGVRVVFWIALACAVISGLVWFYHLVTPECLHFLEEKQVSTIGELLFGGAVSSFISGYAKSQLK